MGNKKSSNEADEDKRTAGIMELEEYIPDYSSDYSPVEYVYTTSEDTIDSSEYVYKAGKEAYDFAGYEYDYQEKEYPLINSEIKTIEQLKKWYVKSGLPDAKITRFFIGINYQDIKAYGIYKSGMNYIVYMNALNGSRSILYEGQDQGYAVKVIYAKLQKAIQHQKKIEWDFDEFDCGDNIPNDSIMALSNKELEYLRRSSKSNGIKDFLTRCINIVKKLFNI